MKEIQEKYIKYLGGAKPLSEVVDTENLSEAELWQTIEKFYTKSSKQIGMERTKFYQEALKVKPKSIKIERIVTRWGSCNTKKEITYNYLLSTLPMELIDYIVVHELCHMHHMNHDRSFWRKLGGILPDYKERIERLERAVIKTTE